MMTAFKKLNTAIIGFGNIAKERHLHAITKEGGNICCIIDPAIEDTIINGIPVYKSLEEAINHNQRIDAVSICTPPNTHAELAKVSLIHGFHVLLEKPPVLNISDLDELEVIAKENGKTLFLAYHTASSPAVYKLQDLLKDKKVLSIEANFLEQVTNWHNPNDWIFKKDISGGGVTRDIGINVISAICKTLPNALFKITNSELKYEEGFDVDTRALVEFEDTVSGAKSKIYLNWLNGSENNDVRTINYTTESGLYILDLSTARLYEEKEGVKVEIETDRDQEYEIVYREFFNKVTGGESYVPRQEVKFIENAYIIDYEVKNSLINR